jgi:TMEM175 potassium channel family protein
VKVKPLRYSRDQAEFDRAIGFIDATFALALTLLVTTLDIPDPGAAFSSLGALNDAVGQQAIAFGIAFAVIANYWLQHHRLIASFTAIDYTTIAVNLFLVAAIVLLPFSTQSVGDPGVEDLPLPTVIMAVNVVLASTLHTLVYVVAVRRNLLSPAPGRGEISYTVVNGLASAAVFGASVPIAYLISPVAAQITWISLIPISQFLGRYGARRRRTIDAA